jgi:UDP-N-acetylglucosamine:LPS N-acetylglucosamine transferase
MLADSSARASYKVCVVSSCGGHLTEVRALLPADSQLDYVFVINDRTNAFDETGQRVHFVAHSERDWKFVLNLVEAWRILNAERPKVIISTGAGIIVPFALVGRICFGTRVVFVETITRLSKPSLTARLMYYLANDFYFQWDSLRRYFPRGICFELPA